MEIQIKKYYEEHEVPEGSKDIKVGDVKEVLSFNIVEPNEHVYFKALGKMMGTDMDIVGAGRIVFDSCYHPQDGQPELKDIKLNPALYSSICLQAATLVQIYEGEVKKN